MPELFDNPGHELEESDNENENHTIPNLFPATLLDTCLSKVQQMVLNTGIRVETRARERIEEETSSSSGFEQRYFSDLHKYGRNLSFQYHEMTQSQDASPALLTDEDGFKSAAKICREFLSTFLAGPVLDSLSESARQVASPVTLGHLFSMSVFCGDRLGRLILHLHTDILSSRSRTWVNFLTSPAGNSLILSSLSQCSGLNSLYIQHIATDEMLRHVADTCNRLTILDISYSSSVTDIGLVHLCGPLVGAGPGHGHTTTGCKYLRELYFNPQNSSSEHQIMPQVIACLLRHLPLLQVVDLSNLHPGIDQYYRGHVVRPDSASAKHLRMKPLNLVHYTGSDRLAEVLQICPKLRTFKLFVTESLASLGTTLQDLGHTLEQITLVYPQDRESLTGFIDFLEACGRRISRLDVECSSNTIITSKDLVAIATYCTQLESLSFTNFHVSPEVDPRVSHSPVPLEPAKFPFLRNVRFSNVIIDDFGKDVFRYIIGGAHDLESLYVSFKTYGYFFSDFLLDDILATNSLSQLQEFILKDGALTLISALRLITSRPKLRIVGRLLHWDVEPCELTTFVQILRKAKSLNLLQDITIV